VLRWLLLQGPAVTSLLFKVVARDPHETRTYQGQPCFPRLLRARPTPIVAPLSRLGWRKPDFSQSPAGLDFESGNFRYAGED
jgi:hypothetical protein